MRAASELMTLALSFVAIIWLCALLCTISVAKKLKVEDPIAWGRMGSLLDSSFGFRFLKLVWGSSSAHWTDSLRRMLYALRVLHLVLIAALIAAGGAIYQVSVAERTVTSSLTHTSVR
jgi:hypothetical protein